MKTKMILMAALLGAAAMSANAGVRFGVAFGLPPVVIPVPVLVARPVVPVPVVETVPACPGEGYVWAPGYWAHRDRDNVWVRGSWAYRPGRDRDLGRDHDRYSHRDHRR